jgi:hypothetical protein
MSDLEGVAVNQLINVAIAEKLAQMPTAKWFADRVAAAVRNPERVTYLHRKERNAGPPPRRTNAAQYANSRRAVR